MAKRVTATLEDDLDGGPADETVRFALGGAEYEIGLSRQNARAFRRKLAPFIDHARHGWAATGPPARAEGREPGAQREHPGVGASSAHRGERSRAHPGQRRWAVPSRHRDLT
jgi:nucleoid-associated protein Lsr2